MLETPVPSNASTDLAAATLHSPNPPIVRRRGAISAEASTQIELPTSSAAPRIPKTPEQMQRLQQSLQSHIMFRHLEDDEREQVFGAMFERTFTDGEVIIKQGDVGNNFYVIEQGHAEIFIEQRDGTRKLVSVLHAGGSFGELALMYGSPRAATVIARVSPPAPLGSSSGSSSSSSNTAAQETAAPDGVVRCWALDRQTYRGILMNVTLRKREMYETFLEKVPVLADCTKWERLQIADALESASYAANELIVRQGEQGDTFYIIVDGVVEVTKDENGVTTNCGQLKPGDYFGELALLTNKPRAATVRAVTVVKCVKLDRDRFDRVLGPCEAILKRNTENYSRVIAAARNEK